MAKTIIRPRKELRIIKVKEKTTTFLNKDTSPIYNKKVPKKAIDAIFKKLENKTLNKFFEKRVKDEKRTQREEDWISKGQITATQSNRLVIPITKSILGTVRIFNTYDLNRHLKKANSFYEKIKKHNNNFDNFEIQPINILGIKKLKTGEYAVLEKVYISPSYFELIYKDTEYNRNQKFIIKFFRDKGIDIKDPQFKNSLKNAYTEYLSKFNRDDADRSEGNLLVLDFNKKTNKFLFGQIDFFGSTETLLK